MNWSLLVRVIAAAALVFCTPACGNTYRGAAIEGRVIDAETKQPLHGVVVVVEWLLEGGIHTDTIGRLLLQETVTDEKGRYRFPLWGPLRPEKGRLDRSSPLLNFYKQGYRFTVHRNQSFEPPYIALPDPLTSEWDGKTIEISPYDSQFTGEDYLKEAFEASRLYPLTREKCVWQEMPRMTAQLVKLEMKYRRNGASAGLPDLGRLHSEGKCADPEILLKEHLHE